MLPISPFSVHLALYLLIVGPTEYDRPVKRLRLICYHTLKLALAEWNSGLVQLRSYNMRGCKNTTPLARQMTNMQPTREGASWKRDISRTIQIGPQAELYSSCRPQVVFSSLSHSYSLSFLSRPSHSFFLLSFSLSLQSGLG